MQGNDKNIVSKVTTIKKIFPVGSVKCTYQNVESHEKKSENIKDSDVHISSRVCESKGAYLEKKIEIKYKNMHMSIVDTYDFGTSQIPESQNQKKNGKDQAKSIKLSTTTGTSQGDGSSKNSGNEEEPKKKRIFEKKRVEHPPHYKPVRKTKNIVKNYVKAFLQYLRSIQQDQILTKIKAMIEVTKYNNTLIYNMIEDEEVCQHFKKFLEEKAQGWIKDSKIQNKDGHRSGINRFLQLIAQSEKNIEIHERHFFHSSNSEPHSHHDASDSDSNRPYMSDQQEEEE